MAEEKEYAETAGIDAFEEIYIKRTDGSALTPSDLDT